jgi:hypothetical protein
MSVKPERGDLSCCTAEAAAVRLWARALAVHGPPQRVIGVSRMGDTRYHQEAIPLLY